MPGIKVHASAAKYLQMYSSFRHLLMSVGEAGIDRADIGVLCDDGE